MMGPRAESIKSGERAGVCWSWKNAEPEGERLPGNWRRWALPIMSSRAGACVLGASLVGTESSSPRTSPTCA